MTHRAAPTAIVATRHVRIQQDGQHVRTLTVPPPAMVGVPQLLLVLNNWGSAGPAGDWTGNGHVDNADLLLVENYWGKPLDQFPPSPPPTGWPFNVIAPQAPVDQIHTLNADGCIDLSNVSDANVPTQSTSGKLRGITIGNGQSSHRCTSNGFTAHGTTDYSFYGGGIFDHYHKNLDLSQAAGVNQACVRIAGDAVVFENATIDNTQAVNDLMRLYGYTDDLNKLSRYYLLNCILKGGILNLGVPPANDPDPNYPKNPVQIWIHGGEFHYGNAQSYPAAVATRRRIVQLIASDWTVTGGGRLLDLDDPTVAKLTNVKYAGAVVRQSDVGHLIQGQTANVVVQ